MGVELGQFISLGLPNVPVISMMSFVIMVNLCMRTLKHLGIHLARV